MPSSGYFARTKPCVRCPFRVTLPIPLHPERAEEIADGLRMGGSFPCHKTTKHDDDGEYLPSRDEMHCAGATIILEKMGEPNQMMRVAERVGAYDPAALDLDTEDVFDDLDDWERAIGDKYARQQRKRKR
jgi:hypothetical protein